MHKAGEIQSVIVEEMGSRGEGIARLDGETIFIPKTAPGDHVRIRLEKKRKGRWLASGIEVETPSPQRADIACRHFEECGGCDLQHLTYGQQLNWKKKVTQHWLQRSPLQPFIKRTKFDAIAAADSYHYRNRVKIQFVQEKPAFFRRRTQEPLVLSECPVLEEGFFDALQEEACLQKNAKDLSYTWCEGHLIGENEEGTYALNGQKLSFAGSSFLQASWKMNERMFDRIVEDLRLVKNKNRAWDLYCGVGNFSGALLAAFDDFLGVDAFGPSIEFAKRNFPKGRWLTHDVNDFIKMDYPLPDYVLLDPPRAGALQASRHLAGIGPSRLTYVSCQLDSLIRDLTALVKNGPFEIERWTTVDLFAQTRHIESIVSLVKSTK